MSTAPQTIESQYSKTEALWNRSGKAARQRLLDQARLDKNQHYARAFAFIPTWVRQSLVAEHKQSQQLSNAPMNKVKAANHARV